MGAGAPRRSGALEKHHGVNLDGEALADGVDLLVGLALEADAVEGDLQEPGDVGAEAVLDGADLRLFEDDGGIGIDDAPRLRFEKADGLGEEDGGVFGFAAWVVVGEELADVGQAGGAEEGIGQGVVEGVAVAVGDGAAVMEEVDAAQNQWASGPGGGEGLEPVEVVSVPDAKFSHAGSLPLRSGEREPEGGSGGRREGLAPFRTIREGQEPSMKARITAAFAAIALLTLAGCQYYHPAGSGYTDDTHTYYSTSHEPKTVSLVDTRTRQTLWTVEIPINTQLTVRFDRGLDETEYLPDTMRWDLLKLGTTGGALSNRIKVPGHRDRVLKLEVRPAELPATATASAG